ncbi:Trans-aconitate methyltransferase [Paenibacillus sp. UNCCL117]|uniref:class I SAM-dependent methyltransferase n=1 Tax=unclassified Paenibacillus TaxID=185978 RepID=UPI00088963BF|nr:MULTISPECIES: class I SAM-dependent methyltransferase [unclassified Paenibacillus]SDC89722.1 Trans-aconitate methyltransferase [Paenibacillus sp. cl123]SFW28630.1 Trans-aconitate methyltransferase [Paenibacillus sp. UNCCL117]
MKVKTGTDNFLHTNPSLYLAFNGEHDNSMAHFIHTLLTEFHTGKTVLDVGCGPGREVAYLNQAGYEAVGLDNSEEMLSWARGHAPGSQFVYGNQADFSLQRQFDVLYCVGSTFLYNFTNEAILASLQCFRQHLRAGGLLYLDMRNAAFFLTEEGQRWLSEELTEQTAVDGITLSLRTRFSIDPVNQLLLRDYCWTVPGEKPIVERLQHRLLFPQELAHYLASSGFRLLHLFDQPAPHIDRYEQERPLVFSQELRGRRMQVIAQAV